MEKKELQVIDADVVITPMTLIQKAQEKDASIEQMQQLFDLQLRWEANEARKAYNQAIADFKSKNIKIIKKSVVDFTSAKGRTYYKHATLGDALEQIIDGMSACGLSNSFKTEQAEGLIKVTCRISHIDGHAEETSLSASPDQSGNKNSIQAIGSTITYLERYTLKAALGLAEHDDDGKGGGKVEYITENQWRELDTLLSQVNDPTINEEYFCMCFRVEGMDLLPANMFKKACDTLNKKIKEQK